MSLNIDATSSTEAADVGQGRVDSQVDEGAKADEDVGLGIFSSADKSQLLVECRDDDSAVAVNVDETIYFNPSLTVWAVQNKWMEQPHA